MAETNPSLTDPPKEPSPHYLQIVSWIVTIVGTTLTTLHLLGLI